MFHLESNYVPALTRKIKISINIVKGFKNKAQVTRLQLKARSNVLTIHYNCLFKIRHWNFNILEIFLGLVHKSSF